MKLIQYYEYSGSTVGTNGLVLKHQGISSYNAVCKPVRFQLFMG